MILDSNGKKVSDNMTLQETQDKDDILILFMISERDKQIELLETENYNLKRILIETLRENKHLEKVVNKLKGGTYDKK